jgi:hypothetical protein
MGKIQREPEKTVDPRLLRLLNFHCRRNCVKTQQWTRQPGRTRQQLYLLLAREPTEVCVEDLARNSKRILAL